MKGMMTRMLTMPRLMMMAVLSSVMMEVIASFSAGRIMLSSSMMILPQHDDDIHDIEIKKQVMRYVLCALYVLLCPVLCTLLCVIRIEVSALQVFHSASNWLTLGTLYFILT